MKKGFITTKSFREKYEISKTHMHTIVHNRDFQEAIQWVGEKAVRIDEELLLELMNKKWRN